MIRLEALFHMINDCTCKSVCFIIFIILCMHVWCLGIVNVSVNDNFKVTLVMIGLQSV